MPYLLVYLARFQRNGHWLEYVGATERAQGESDRAALIRRRSSHLTPPAGYPRVAWWGRWLRPLSRSSCSRTRFRLTTLWWRKRARRPNAWSRTTAGARQEEALGAAARCPRRQPQWLPALPAPQCAPWRRRLLAEALWRATWHRRAFAAAIRTGAVEALEKLDCGSLSRCQQGRYNRATMISSSGVATCAGAVA